MVRTSTVVAGVIVGVALSGALHAQQPASPASSTASTPRALLNRYCVTCHNERLRTAELTLDTLDVAQVGDHAAVWEKVVRKLRAGAMPPAGRPRPDPATYEVLASYFEDALDRAAAAKPNPGRPAVHRLNRAEYTNAIRDLLALEVDGRSLLPPDDSGYGFDNNGDVLSVSPGLLERYMLAAAKISRLAIGDPTIRPATTTYRTSPLMLQDDRLSEDLPFGSRGGLAVRHHFPLDGEYVIKIGLERAIDGVGSNQGQIDVRLDRGRVKLITLGAPRSAGDAGDGGQGPDPNRALEVRFSTKAGTHLVGVAFVGGLDQSLPRDGRPPRPPVTSFAFQQYPIDPAISSVHVTGPYNAQVPEETASRRLIFVCRPADMSARSGAGKSPRVSDGATCARQILSTLARRAYRRPVTDADVEPLLRAYERGRSVGALRQASPERRSSFDQAQDDRSRRPQGVVSPSNHDFEAGIRGALEAILVSPKFLFRVERDPANASPGAPYRISDVELASRLSFFLWSSVPDDELLDLTVRGRLSDPAVLEQQVRRLLTDTRSKALVSNFAGQWLWQRNLRTAAPNATVFPDFDDNLREALQHETELFLDSQVREDRSVLDLLRANYTFVNERLAQHYGIPNVYGNHFRRVMYSDDRRAGLLGHGSVLTVTSHPNRTSPVVRGKWLLENLLGAPPPPPPPNVPALRENDEGGRPTTVRQRMEQHRANPVCATCHAQMDPLGFALENFDAIGKWRDRDGEANAPIDASGTLPDGTKFSGPAEFRQALLSRSGQFVTNVTEKLLTYALGRGLDYYDMPAARQIVREAEPTEYRWSSIILGIVKSAPFQMRTAAPAPTTVVGQ